MKHATGQLIKQHAYFNQQFFAKFAKLYDYEKYFLFPIRNNVARSLVLPKNSKILDVATGTGALAYALAKQGYIVIGLDLSAEMLNQAKKKLRPGLRLSFIRGDATKIPYATNAFDASTISWGLHDMPYEIRLLVLKEMIRVTKPGGIILVMDYLEPNRGLIPSIAHSLERLYETPMFEDFVRRGLLIHLSHVGLLPYYQGSFLNLVQIVLCKNNKN